MIGGFAHFLLRHPGFGWTILATLSTAAAIGLFRLEYDDDLRNAFGAERNFGALRVPEDAFVCIVGGDGLTGGDVIGKLIEFDLELRKVPGIEEVTSVFGKGDGTERLFGSRPAFSGSSDGLPSGLLTPPDDTGLTESFLSGDHGTMLFFAAPAPERRLVEDLVPVQREIQGLLSDLGRRTGLEVAVTGIPTLRIRINETIRREHLIFSMSGCLLGAAVAYLVFRRVAAVLIIFPIPVISTFWTLGGMGLAGEAVDALNTMAAVVIPIIALTDAIHLTFAIRRHRIEGKAPREAAGAGLSEVGTACFMTSFTTAVSFGSLAISGNQIVARFGVTCAIATMLAYGAVILLTPLLAGSILGQNLLPLQPGLRAPRFFDRNAAVVARHPRLILAGTLVLLAVTIFACLRLDFDFRYRENLDPSTAEWRAIERLETGFGGSQPLTVLVDWGEAAEWSDGDLVNLLRGVHDAVSVPDSTGRPFSVLNVLESARRADPKADLANLEQGVYGEWTRKIMHSGERVALVTVPLKDRGAKALAPVLNEMEGRLLEVESDFPGAGLRLVGLTATSIRESRTMIRELTASLFWAGLLIFGAMGIFLRSWSLGFASVIPNLIPLLIGGAWIYLQGQDILYVSALTFCLSLGIAVDDTIHFLFRYQENRKRGIPPVAAVRETLTTIGTSLATTTGILLAGFSLLLLSELPTVRICGIMGILTLSSALLCDLIVLPALLLAFRKSSPDENNDTG